MSRRNVLIPTFDMDIAISRMLQLSRGGFLFRAGLLCDYQKIMCDCARHTVYSLVYFSFFFTFSLSFVKLFDGVSDGGA